MSWWSRVRRPAQLDKELELELQDHLDRLAAEHLAHGVPEAEARRRAALAFGGIASIREEARDARGFAIVADLVHDVRHAVRSLTRTPGFSVLAILMLGLGIGSATAIFAFVSALGVNGLPFQDPVTLVQLSGYVEDGARQRRGASYPDYLDWRAQSTSFIDLAAFDGQQMTLATEEPARIGVEFVSAPYFNLLGVAPTLGRTFLPVEDTMSPSAVVIISNRFWQERLGGASDVVGRTIALNGGVFTTYTVVGVMPPGFRGVTDSAELWLPFTQWAPATIMNGRGQRAFAVLGRLGSAATLETAQAELDDISRRLQLAYPDTNARRGVEVTPLHEELLGSARPALWTMMGAVALVLLAACANVVNLLMTRTGARRRELAVRRAMGASGGRLLRQMLTEIGLLGALSTLFAALLAHVSIAALLAWSPLPFPSFVSPALDLGVGLFMVAVAVSCGLVLTVMSVLPLADLRLSDALKDGSRTVAGSPVPWVRQVITVTEVALAIVLTAAAGSMIQSFRNLLAVDPGFAPSSVLTLRVTIPRESRGSPATVPVAESRVLLERLRAVPGVVSTALGTDLPLDGTSAASFFTVDGEPPVRPEDRPRAYRHRVSPEFFRTLRIPILAGRTFTAAELTPTPTVALVSEGLAKRYWSVATAVGKHVHIGRDRLTVVGVVGDVRYRRLPENPDSDPDIYIPFGDTNQQASLAIRTAVMPASLLATVRAAIRDIDRRIVVYAAAPMEDLVARWSAGPRFMVGLMNVFAAIGLALSGIGIYGVASFLIAQRTREIGVRMALGASRGQIVKLVLHQSAVSIAVGIAIGLGGAVMVGRALQSLLFEVNAVDLMVIVATSFIFGGVALVACYVPSRTATRIDPLIALRHD